MKSYLKVGFVIEGRARDAIWRDGRYWDEISMSILESDWRHRESVPAPDEPGRRTTRPWDKLTAGIGR